MKEVYLQKKLTELSEECQIIRQRITMRTNELETLEQRLGDLRILLERLKNIEQFKHDILKELIEENNNHLTEINKDLHDQLEKQLDNKLEKKSFLLNETLTHVKKDAALFQKNQEVIDEAQSTASYVKEFHRLLMLKLINKGILSHRELKEIEQRAEKHMRK